MAILSISENILSLIAGLGIVQGFLLAFLISFHPKSDSSVNKFLAFYIISLSLVMSGPLVMAVLPWQKTFFLAPLPFLPGPALYLYIRSYRQNINWKKALPHFIIFAVYFGVAYGWVSYLSKKYPGSESIPEELFLSPVGIILFISRYAHLVIYYLVSYRELRNYQRSIQQYFSETSQIDLKWGKWLVNGYMFIVAASFFIFFLMISYIENFYTLYLINIAIATPYIYGITYKGITQPTIWQKNINKDKQSLEAHLHGEKEENKTTPEKRRYQKTVLSESKIVEIITKTTVIMEQDKLYQETELTLQDLADKLQYPPHQVSYAINEGLKKNFYDLINSYRVEEAKRLLLDQSNRNFTILSVGFDSGFNSKTTFNTVFKKFTGQTPTDFRNQQRLRVAAT